VEIARLPEGIRGFGHVKERNLQTVRTKWQAQMAQWRQAPAAAKDVAEAQRQTA
jgi:indolepyruvate ferredoxin oxidoreductase